MPEVLNMFSFCKYILIYDNVLLKITHKFREFQTVPQFIVITKKCRFSMLSTIFQEIQINFLILCDFY